MLARMRSIGRKLTEIINLSPIRSKGDFRSYLNDRPFSRRTEKATDAAPARVTSGSSQVLNAGKLGAITMRRSKPAAKLIPRTSSRPADRQMPMHATATSVPNTAATDGISLSSGWWCTRRAADGPPCCGGMNDFPTHIRHDLGLRECK